VTVTPFDLAACPPVGRAEAAASRALARFLAGVPPVWTVDLPLLGKATLEPAAVVPSVPADAIAIAVRRDGVAGRLSVPAPLASRWVDVALCGSDGFGPARELGRAERGVLIALLAPVLDAAGWSLGLGPPPERGGPAVALRLTAAAGGGTLWLQVPPGPGSRGPRPVDDGRAGGLRVVASLQVARTTLTNGQLAQLAVGDAVLFDGVASIAADPEAERDIELWLGDACVTLRVAPDGRATVANGWRHATRMHDAKDVTKDVSTQADRTLEPGAALSDAPIEVVAELGRITLPAGEVLGLAPGVVLGLRVEQAGAVVLRIGGAVWAEGELVNVDGELGVRVTRLTGG
jgi:type III secretion system YscQ/HrcQ family protein